MIVSFGYLRLSGAFSGSTEAKPVPIEQTVITDAAMLAKINPAFYQGAKNGDVVLRFENRLELFRPSEERLIRTVPLN
jgi:hypothetical protein